TPSVPIDFAPNSRGRLLTTPSSPGFLGHAESASPSSKGSESAIRPSEPLQEGVQKEIAAIERELVERLAKFGLPSALLATTSPSNAETYGRQRVQELSDGRKTLGEVSAIAAVEPGVRALFVGLDVVADDLVHPRRRPTRS